MEEIKNNSYEAVVERLKDNRFYQHRMEIRKLAEEMGVDIGVALDMYRAKMGWMDEESFHEMRAFDAEVGAGYQAEITRKIFGYEE